MLKKDEFLVDLYDSIHDSKMQQKLRKIAPMPIGVVFLQNPDMSMKDIRTEFKKMKQLGFTNLKQCLTLPGTNNKEVMHIALEEGIIPWWYDEGGFEDITDELLEKLGIPLDTSIEMVRNDKRMIEYQTKLMHERIDRVEVIVPSFDPSKAPLEVGVELNVCYDEEFLSWLKMKYENVKSLNIAWNMNHVLIAPDNKPFEDWEDVKQRWRKVSINEYRHLRDILRFKSDATIHNIKDMVDIKLKNDPNEPLRAGGEMGLFLPFAYRGTDMEGIAEVMKEGGSFYPSIHLAWHFDEVNHEIARPIYMQAAITNDWFKGGWSATWESTGGPQQFSGGKGGGGFTVDEGTITQLMLSYLGAGYKGFGFWSWNVRTAGWEAGEYGLLDRNGKPTIRAITAGKVGQAARKYRYELWKAHKEPLVGVFCDFDNEAIWAAISVPNRDKFKQEPINSRVGISRALINNNIPYEYVTGSDLRNGLAMRYKVIYLSKIIAINDDIMQILHQYVKQGGKLIIDMPSAWFDEYGKLMNTDAGSIFENTFGLIINESQFANNVPYIFNGSKVEGFVMDITPTYGKVLEVFSNGKTAIIEAKSGSGTSIFMNFEASGMCFKPGNTKFEDIIKKYVLGELRTKFVCEDAVVYRLAAPEADHYFVINDADEKDVLLNTPGYSYKSFEDAVTGEKLEFNKSFKVASYSGRWLRFVK